MLDPVDLASASHTGRRVFCDMFILAKSCIDLHAKCILKCCLLTLWFRYLWFNVSMSTILFRPFKNCGDILPFGVCSFNNNVLF